MSKIALDIHGVIDTNAKFFSDLTHALRRWGFEVHVLTGSHIKEKKIKEQLEEMGIAYTHLFSISDYHREIGTKMWGDEENPWMDQDEWNSTKATYCAMHKIDLCLDDRDGYFEHFTTPCARYYSKGIEND